jgi:hypothetical protein
MLAQIAGSSSNWTQWCLLLISQTSDCSVDRGGDDDRAVAIVEEDVSEAECEEFSARVVVQRGALSGQRGVVVVDYEEDGATVPPGAVADDGAHDKRPPPFSAWPRSLPSSQQAILSTKLLTSGSRLIISNGERAPRPRWLRSTMAMGKTVINPSPTKASGIR